MSPPSPPKIFLSYGLDSAEDARILKEDLETSGLDVWMDQARLKPGADWESKIEEGLLRCDQVVLLMTPYAVRRRNPADPESTDGYSLNEIAKALQYRKEIVPVMLVWVEEGPPTSICRLQWLDMTACRPLALRSPAYTARFKQLVDAIRSGTLAVDGEQAHLVRLLKPADFKLEIRRHLGSFCSRPSIEAQVDEWLLDRTGPPILWVVGRPGVGKSAFAVNVCHRRGDAFYMCIRGYTDQNDPRSVLTTIAFQLATHLPEYLRRLSRLPTLEDELEKGAAEIFDNVLLAPLSTHDFPAPERAILVVIDGLDEATMDGRNELAQLIARRVPQLPSWIRFIVTSREEQELIGPLRSQRRVRLSADDAENLQAIRASFAECLRELDVPHDEDLLGSLVRKSEGVFLWVTYVMEALRRGERSVAELPDLPAGLEAWYLSDFQRRFDDMTVYQRDLKPLLEAIISQRAPLPLSILHEALGISLTELSRRIGKLGSLFPVREESSRERTIQAAHSSLRQWLIGIDEGTFVPIAGDYALDAEHGETLLAEHGWSLYERGRLTSSPYHFGFLAEHLAASRQHERLRALLTDLDLLVKASQAGRKYEWMKHWLRAELDPVQALSQALEHRSAAAADKGKQAEWAGEVGAFLRDLGLTAEALPFLERSIQLRSENAEELSVELGSNLRDLAELHRIQKNFEKALDLYQQALAIFDRQVGPRSPQVATVYHDLAVLHRDQRRYAEALSYNQRALQLRESLEPIDYRGLADCINDVGVLLWETSRSRHAEGYYRRALEIAEKLWPADDPLTAVFLHNIGQLKEGDPDDADLHFLRRALRIFEATYVPHHPDLQGCRRVLASHLEARGYYLEALNLRETVLKNTIVASGADSEAAATAKSALELCRRRQEELASRIAQTCAEVDRVPDTGDLRKRALEAARQYATLVGEGRGRARAASATSAQDGNLADALFQFGAYLQDFGYYAAAARFLTLARAAADGRSEDRSLLLRIVTRLGATHQRRHEHRQAMSYESERLELLLERTPLPIKKIIECCCKRVSLSYAAGDHEAARDYGRGAIQIVERARGAGSAEAVDVRASVSRLLNEYAMALKNEQGNFSAAEPYYRLALEMVPTDATFRGNLAVLLTSGLEQHDEAEKLYLTLLADSRTDPTTLGNYAFFLHHVRKDVAGARRLFEEALGCSPAVSSVYCNYAASMITIGERGRAAQLLKSAWSMPLDKQSSPRILFVKATLELLEGRDATFYWGQLRFLFETGVLHNPWRASEFVAYLEESLPADDLPLARSMARALSSREHLERLRKTPEWQSSSFVPLDEMWPG
jgi:tetratricopeptide (TPR) repeat protein